MHAESTCLFMAGLKKMDEFSVNGRSYYYHEQTGDITNSNEEHWAFDAITWEKVKIDKFAKIYKVQTQMSINGISYFENSYQLTFGDILVGGFFLVGGYPARKEDFNRAVIFETYGCHTKKIDPSTTVIPLPQAVLVFN